MPEESSTKNGIKTAAVTGAASGIGKAFSLALARRGYDLILIDRSAEGARELAEKIAAEYPGRTAEILTGDLTRTEDLEAAGAKLASCPTLEMVVNAAGFGICANYSESPWARQKAMIDIHVVASMRLTHAALQVMVPRDSGAIINLGSISAFTRFPQTATYAGSKMYIVAFMESLTVELEKMGVHHVRLQALCPGQTRTPFTDTEEMRGFDPARIPAFLWMTPEEVVEMSLARVERGSGTYVPHIKNRLYLLAFANPIVTRMLGFLRKLGVLELALRIAGGGRKSKQS